MIIDVDRVSQLHTETVQRWHNEPIDNTYEGVMSIICKQHSFNFLLWHEEDIARSPNVGDTKVAAVKRAIDGYNQNRNDWIEKIDDWITGYLGEARVSPRMDAPLNTETPGSVIDRLSIMSLRIYHMLEQSDRDEASETHVLNVRQKLALCIEQQKDLSQSLRELLSAIEIGDKRHKTYRQMKMYNDPTLNPYLYDASLKKAG